MAENLDNQQNEFDLDQKVNVKNIAGWEVGFNRIETNGSVRIAADGSTKLSRSEIIAQIHNGNTLFNGVDGKGSHATLYIDDAATRREVGFDSEDGAVHQLVFTDEAVKNLFTKNSSQSAFQKSVTNLIRTRAEKYAIIQSIIRQKINDYSRIRFVEDYTGFKVQ